jgi:hypothetical protein
VSVEWRVLPVPAERNGEDTMSNQIRLRQIAWFFERKSRIVFLTVMSYAALC